MTPGGCLSRSHEEGARLTTGCCAHRLSFSAHLSWVLRPRFLAWHASRPVHCHRECAQHAHIAAELRLYQLYRGQ